MSISNKDRILKLFNNNSKCTWDALRKLNGMCKKVLTHVTKIDKDFYGEFNYF